MCTRGEPGDEAMYRTHGGFKSMLELENTLFKHNYMSQYLVFPNQFSMTAMTTGHPEDWAKPIEQRKNFHSFLNLEVHDPSHVS